MSWHDRPYYREEPGSHEGRGGGLGSWVAGMPPVTRAVKWIIIANAAIHFASFLTAAGGGRGLIFQWFSMNTVAVMHGQVWRLLTFTYLHGDFWHIFFNMLILYFLGGPLEHHLGAKRFFQFYTAGGICAVALYLLLTLANWLESDVPLIGASGNVYAVMGACAVLFPGFRLIIVLFPVPIRMAVLIFTAFIAANLLARGSNAGGDACHLAGMAFGVAWGYRGRRWSEWWEGFRSRRRQGAWEQRVRRRQDEEAEVDQILDKIKYQGIASLSNREKQILEEATRRQREGEPSSLH